MVVRRRRRRAAPLRPAQGVGHLLHRPAAAALGGRQRRRGPPRGRPARVLRRARAPYGAMAERTLVPRGRAARRRRGRRRRGRGGARQHGPRGLARGRVALRAEPGETVLVLGATGAVGSVAVQAAKLLGAGRVVAADRGGDRLPACCDRGADAVVEVDGPGDLAEAIREAAGGEVDVTIDMLWGAPALAAMHGRRPPGPPRRGGQHGRRGAERCPAALLRSACLDVRGFSVAHPAGGRQAGGVPAPHRARRAGASSSSTSTACHSTTSRRRGNASAGPPAARRWSLSPDRPPRRVRP